MKQQAKKHEKITKKSMMNEKGKLKDSLCHSTSYHSIDFKDSSFAVYTANYQTLHEYINKRKRVFFSNNYHKKNHNFII